MIRNTVKAPAPQVIKNMIFSSQFGHSEKREIKRDRLDIIGQNGNDGAHYAEVC